MRGAAGASTGAGAGAPVRGPARRDRRIAGLLLTAAAVFVLGLAIARIDDTPASLDTAAPRADPLRQPFADAVALLQAGHYREAEPRWRALVVRAPRLPEARVNLGYTLLGLQRADEARAAFEAATDIAPAQANAYYGLALAHEAAGDMDAAIGAMRTYLHLARSEREEHLRRARSALWEWEAQRDAARRR